MKLLKFLITNNYNVLTSLCEEYLGGEDFTQRLINYLMKEIKKIIY